MQLYQSITLKALNLYNIVCQLYVSKAGKKKKSSEIFDMFFKESYCVDFVWGPNLLGFFKHSLGEVLELYLYLNLLSKCKYYYYYALLL